MRGRDTYKFRLVILEIYTFKKLITFWFILFSESSFRKNVLTIFFNYCMYTAFSFSDTVLLYRWSLHTYFTLYINYK